MKKRKWMRAVALMLTAVLVIGSAVTVLADNEKKETVPKEQKSQSGALNQEREGRSEDSSQEGKSRLSMEKEETVYVLTGADGSVQKTIVSDWLKNPLGKESITDMSQLKEIKNVKGEETFSQGSGGALNWEAKGNDIYYQGITDKTLPVGVSIEYKLDGKEISCEELAGKSGKVTITIRYENRQKETVLVNGTEEELFVPFAAVSGTILNNEKFKNIQVSNGKIINDGDKTIVAGFALPGMQENLQISKEDLEIPETVEITADVENFSMETVLTVVTNEIFNQTDFSDKENLEELKEAASKLEEACGRLMDGSSALYDGLETLLSKSDELISGVNQLEQGAASLEDGAGELTEGAGTLLAGTASLKEGLETLSSNSETLRTGAKTVFESLLSNVENQLKEAGLSVPVLTIENYSQVLNQIMGSMTEEQVRKLAYNTALSKVTDAVNAKKAQIEAGVTAVVKENVTAQVEEKVIPAVTAQAMGQSMTAEQYRAALDAGQIPEALKQAVDAQVYQNVEAQMESSAVKQTIASNTEAQIQAFIQQNMESAEVKAQIEAAVTQAAAGSGQVAAAKAGLDSFQEFYEGLKAYTVGVDQAYGGSLDLYEGTAQLAEGTAKLFTGSKSLHAGLKTMQSGGEALKEGVSKLTDGAMQLSDGCRQFYKEGIQKLVDVMNGDLGNVVERLKACADASKAYCNFSGIADGMDGNVRFLYRTDSIEAE